MREARKRIRLLEQENEVLRRVAAYLSQANLPQKRGFPVVTGLAADGVPVTVSCRVLKLCRQQDDRWLAEPMTDAELDEAYLANAIFDAHRDDPEFGYRFLADEARVAGRLEAGDRTVWRICAENGWCAASPRERPARSRRRRQLPTMTWSAVGSPPMARTRSGSRTRPSIAATKARSTAARSRTCGPTGSSAGPSTNA